MAASRRKQSAAAPQSVIVTLEPKRRPVLNEAYLDRSALPRPLSRPDFLRRP
jgi:hypothetical protein